MIHQRMIIWVACLCFGTQTLFSQSVPAPLKRFLDKPMVRGASVALMVKEVNKGTVVYEYESERQLIPASVMKTVTAATALEILGEDFRFETSVSYDGEIRDSILRGNLYLCGSGDPTLNSSELDTPKDSILRLWSAAIRKAGICEVTGALIVDESIFDTEGVSMKWMREDLGSEYGQGSYGLNIFDNRFRLYLESGVAGTTPTIKYCEPDMPSLTFHNYVKAVPAPADSCFITGFPFSDERYLYGAIPARRSHFKLTADIPDPALFAARYVHAFLQREGIRIKGTPSCHRILAQAGQWKETTRKTLITTYSPPLKDLARIFCFVSHNLYADAVFKTLGLRYAPSSKEAISSFGRGAQIVTQYWKQKGIDSSSLWMFDGSGLAITNKVTAEFLCDVYTYMALRSKASDAFVHSLPRAGIDGTLRNMMKGSSLQGKARLKSGSMSRVLCYGGYMDHNGKRYAVVILVNNFTGKSRRMRASIEELLLSLFKKTTPV